MPSSQKPRKPHKPKRAAYNCFAAKDIADVRSRIELVELKALTRLQPGDCDYDCLGEFRDMFNAVLFACMDRSKVLEDDTESLAAIDEITSAACLMMQEKRAHEDRHPNEPVEKLHYIFSGDAQQKILRALNTAIDFARDSLSQCPALFLDEFNGSLVLRDAMRDTQRFTVTKKIVAAAIEEARLINRARLGAETRRATKRAHKRLSTMVKAEAKRRNEKNSKGDSR